MGLLSCGFFKVSFCMCSYIEKIRSGIVCDNWKLKHLFPSMLSPLPLDVTLLIWNVDASIDLSDKC